MKYDVVKISAEQWATHAQVAHLAVFDEMLPPEYDRIDFALLVVEKALNRPVAYLTARELDRDSVYLKHGGPFPPIKGTVQTVATYLQVLTWLRERYKRITTLVENTNRSYLKMTLHAGFKVIGVRQFKGSLLVELFLGDETAP